MTTNERRDVDGTVFLKRFYPASEPDEFFRILGQGIVDVTGKPYVHTSWYADGIYYDDTVWRGETGHLYSGIRAAKTLQFEPGAILVPEEPLLPMEIHDLGKFSQYQMHEWGNHYGYFHLVLMAVTYPTRGLWDKIGWSPMERLVHDVCSTAPVEAFRYGAFDPFPGRQKDEIAPGDWLEAKHMKRTA